MVETVELTQERYNALLKAESELEKYKNTNKALKEALGRYKTAEKGLEKLLTMNVLQFVKVRRAYKRKVKK
jgi:hypothetical protein